MNLKLIGFAAAILGIVGIFISTPKIMSAIPFVSEVPIKYILIPSVILVGVGIIIVMSFGEGGGRKHIFHHKTKMGEEVPIFHNKEIVGYRITK